MDIVRINVAEPVSAGSVSQILSTIPNIDPIVKVLVRGLEVEVHFDVKQTASIISSIRAYAPSLPLSSRKLNYIKSMSKDTADAISGGVESDATGTSYFYDTGFEDQFNLLSAIIGGLDSYWHVRPYKNSEKIAVMHTLEELAIVGAAVKDWKQSRINLFQTFKTGMMGCTTTAEAAALHSIWNPT